MTDDQKASMIVESILAEAGHEDVLDVFASTL